MIQFRDLPLDFHPPPSPLLPHAHSTGAPAGRSRGPVDRRKDSSHQDQVEEVKEDVGQMLFN